MDGPIVMMNTIIASENFAAFTEHSNKVLIIGQGEMLSKNNSVKLS